MALLLVSTIFVPTAAVLANGVIICPHPHPHPHPRPHPLPRPRPIHFWTPFAIASQRVDVAINDLSAQTRIEQVFVNRSRRPVEGTYLFPVAAGAAVHDFSMWMNGREVSAELLDADRARRIYESIVSRMKDPALLQYAGCGLIQAKVFPIPPGGECRIKLEYGELLRRDSGLTGYSFPLAAAAGSQQPIEQFSLRAVIRTAQPLLGVFSTSHDCSIDRRGGHEAVVGLEKARLDPDNDFRLFYQTGQQAFGLSLLTHRRGGQDGFFMARISPRIGSALDASMPKNICFVLDTSGSMADDNKIAQAKRALKFCITNLGREDRFRLVTFSTEVRPFRAEWSRTDEATLDAARAFTDELKAVGGTDINAALQHALSMSPARSKMDLGLGVEPGGRSWRNNPYFIVFITDGEPTVGVTDPAAILKNVSDTNATKQARLFVLGVGYQVNTKLLDRLADDNGGARDYVTPSEDLELKISAFYSKLANPVLAALKLVFEGVAVHDLYPKRLPDLFQGSELTVVGRYREAAGGPQKINLSGTTRGDGRTYSYPCVFASRERGNDFLPRVWAVRKIGHLLDELRLHGQSKELKDEVIRLSKKYGIMTPYTSFLVQEDDKIARRTGAEPVGGWRVGRSLRGAGAFSRNQADMEEASAGQSGTTGAQPVDASRSNLKLRNTNPLRARQLVKELAEYQRDDAGRQVMNFIGTKTFYWEYGQWIDAEYDGKARKNVLTSYSRDYYDFVAANEGVGRFLAQGERVVLCWKGQVYETVPAVVAVPGE
jgi:Ca-activated chloride channel family protein